MKTIIRTNTLKAVLGLFAGVLTMAANAAQAAEVVSLLEPHSVIPMHYHVPDSTLKLDSVGKFLKEMGLDKVAPQEVLKISRSGLPDETQVVVLEMKTKEEAA